MAAVKPRTHRKSASSTSKRKRKKPAKNTAQSPSVRREIYGVVVAALTLLLILSLVSHRPAAEEHNWIGQVGQVVAEGVFFLFGIGAFALAGLCVVVAAWLLFGRKYAVRPTALFGAGLVTLALVTCLSVLFPSVEAWAVPLGGWIGTSIAGSIVGVIGRAGAVLVLIAAGLIGLMLVTRASLVETTSSAVQKLQDTGITEGVRVAVGSVRSGVTGVFARRSRSQAPPLPENLATDEAFEDAEDEAEVEDLEASANAPQEVAPAPVPVHIAPAPAEPEIKDEAAPPVPEAPAQSATPPPSKAIPVRMPAPRNIPPSTVQDTPEIPAPALAAAAAPVREEPASDASSVAARARRAIAAFRRGGKDAPAASNAPAAAAAVAASPAVHIPPASHLAQPETPDAPHIPVAERSDHFIHNPMIDTTRQNAALDVRDLDDEDAGLFVAPPPAPNAAPYRPAADSTSADAASDAAPLPIAEPQRLEADIGMEAVEALEREEPSQSLEISVPSSSMAEDMDMDDDFQEQATRPVEVLQESAPVSIENLDADKEVDADADEDEDSGPQIIESAAKSERFGSETMERALRAMDAQRERDAWTLPSLDMLSYEESTTEIDEEGLRAMAALLVEALADYKVKGRVTGICPGPVVTRFEFEPEPGTKVRKISGLSTDIAMRLRAENVRIIAPIPGKGCVGVEIPNDIRETVFLKEVLADRRFTEAKSKTALALGKDIEGFPVVADLSKMPHLLVAGTTGSGKSVAINSMIMSVLYNASPDDVRMILIDPKQLEFALYEDIPHLLLPVVTDPNQAATALQWAVDEMERRYRLMKLLRVRNLEGYNEKLKALQEEVETQQGGGKPASKFALDALSEEDPDGRPTHRHMPYLIVVVDEFADLMMAAGKDVEIAVARIAQKARAAGIHCVLATQRPSVDVLTGTIKSNFPTRMSFRLISGTDSRTVLDTVGAEDLLGMGDMLYRPPGSSDLVRVHGAFVDEDEIERVVTFVKDQREAEFDQSILSAQVEASESDDEVDAKFDDAVEVVVEAGYASISMVQRRLSVGYNRAANIIEEMERRGIVGPSGGGASRREVLV